MSKVNSTVATKKTAFTKNARKGVKKIDAKVGRIAETFYKRYGKLMSKLSHE